jgi:hypothetical protein
MFEVRRVGPGVEARQPEVQRRPDQNPTNRPRKPTKCFRWCPVVVERPSCALEKH